jgi:hypothetical protein
LVCGLSIFSVVDYYAIFGTSRLERNRRANSAAGSGDD